MKKTLLLMMNLSLALLCSCGQAPETAADRFVEDLLQKMTLEEKIGQLNQLSGDYRQTGPNRVSADKVAEIEKGALGSLLNVFGAETTRKLQEHALKSRLGIPLVFAQDVIHGFRTTFPIPLAEAASWDLEAIERSARIAGEEAAAAGIHWTFAPMVDVTRDPRWGRVMEGAGEDPYLGSQIARARVRGFQGSGIGTVDAVAACAKHFAAYGAAQAGRDYHTTDMSERILREVYFPPFQAAIDAGAATFMSAFNDLNGVPATGNRFLLRKVLRDEWNYGGVVVSDWGAIRELVPHGYAADDRDAALKAMQAGCDIDMESNCYNRFLAELVRQGAVPETLVDEAVRRVLRMKYDLGLFEDPFRFCDTVRERTVLADASHRQAAREMAERSIVLLDNKSGVLPLDPKIRRIALIGPLAKSERDMKGAWSIQWDDRELVSLYEGLFERVPAGTEIRYARGCEINSSDRSGFAGAVAAARASDVVVMAVGEAFDMSGEARSRTDIGLPGVQEELIRAVWATGKPVVVVLMCGRPMTIEWTAEHVGSILCTWWLGSEAGNAIARVLYGDYNPSGKLPMTFPRSVGQIPLYYSLKNTGRPAPDDHAVSYGSAYIDLPNAPRYAFGHGLSYTTFDYSDLRLSSDRIGADGHLEVSCTVTNSGSRDGEEVVQLYVRDLVGSVTRPLKELKGFRKLLLRAGESQTVEFEIDAAQFAFYDQEMQWCVEPGEFQVMIGSASDDIRLTGSFEVVE